MGARETLESLRATGILLTLTETGLIASPKAALTDHFRALIRVEREDLIACLQADESVRTALIKAINRCCDARGDDDANRAALISECSLLPPAGQVDMCDHFTREEERLTAGRHPDVQDLDDRRVCGECRHYRAGRCGNDAAARVGADLGPIALMLQRCPGFARARAVEGTRTNDRGGNEELAVVAGAFA